MNLDVVKLTQDLIAYPSVSLSSNVDVTRFVIGILDRLRFEVEELPYIDVNGVAKLSIVAKLGKGKGGLSLLSHNDVVPAFAEQGWTSDPFKGRLYQGKLYGRGSCDMKGPLAATLCAATRFKVADLKAPLHIVVTSDEEIAARGAWEVSRKSNLFSEASTGYGLICEPTRLRVVHAHKGALYLEIRSKGKAAHTSTLKGINANIAMIPFLQEMRTIYDLVLRSRKYRNAEFSPAHSEWSIGINDYNIATNVTPVQSVCTISYRPMPGTEVDELIERTRQSAKKHGLRFAVKFDGKPVYTPKDAPLVRTALQLSGTRASSTVPYGTDGLAFASRMKNLVVLGPGDIAQAHTVDEWVEIEQLHRAVDLYSRFIDHVCVQGRA
ncbi:MAG: M20/M25/M40 family metallo-hydrolase [Candidatus Handelsmanbacteria bacterium]|nr:M20/M25/M40 family metallo-hydrolase [Candidatus Handelsmanbacteria bacterium]